MLAPSERALAGSGCVSMKRPSKPTATPALAMVSIRSGRPPVTPADWLGCCSEWVQSSTTGQLFSCIALMPRKSTMRSWYPNVVPRSVIMTLSLPLSRTFPTANCMDSGDMNWPFLTFTQRPVRAAATKRSVCRHKNAGICSTSATSAAHAASSSVWMSVTMGTCNSSFTFFRMASASSLPIPVKECREERLAFL